MNKTILINQLCLGDILFCQKIAAKLIENGYDVYWPLSPNYKWISDYLKRDGLFFFYRETDEVLELRNSIESNHPVDIMTCKYEMLGKTLTHLNESLHSISYKDWSSYIPLQRNHEKENMLYDKVLGLKEDSEYIFINKNYGSGQRLEDVGSHVKNHSLRTIEQSFVNGFTAFDWCKVLENATEIHTADTSINYIIELLDCKAEDIIIHPRHEDTYRCLSRLFNTNFSWSGHEL